MKKIPQIRIFHSLCYEELQMSVNAWLREVGDKVEVRTVSFESTSALVYYLELESASYATPHIDPPVRSKSEMKRIKKKAAGDWSP